MGPEGVQSPSISQRANDVAQAQLTGESAAVLARKKADAADQLRRDKIRQEREQRRREFERRAETGPDEAQDDDGPSVLDVVV